mmetsp:Transcript_19693/g.33157  ORF Transcript_19693/g.33157 Transcript_19693/m.33157 type:complete len:416 (-) Transcript_19693:281-1528(-)|eukprot:CAMPEP_0114430766 /NCGR_PEP_ID=MMETSP0103-20121206/10219_1 /TAXON_ID=37642 ORGANISM="Paraphysomonas imperforata, Strain PA2" /NCGR_SAMPLE_ID=MMETSP0103 /ASSEMBLY_ACC=CAM_ASM_000201 /LENGTH=415 /DNA_ID=CAMNT_0001600241 /DNA_START=54 /DNA_END=1301 /DNA_ORIENTATION=-
MGNSASTPTPSEPQSPPSAPANAISECPVKHKNTPSECPVKGEKPNISKYKNPNQYNVYSQKIDPKNNMPLKANQEMAPDQKIPLDTARVKSNIPKGGTDDDSWTYPSPQMFWNSLVRKGKVDDAEEQDMDTVVAIHNNMNENTWSQLLAWEKLHPVEEEGREPKLLHFLGRPHDLSPKARLKMLFGHPAPFDRHDWVVDRGGVEVRYVIDYYHNESGVSEDQTPRHLKDATSIRSINVDVRPAIDSVDSLLDRILRMPIEQMKNNTEYNPPPFLASKDMGTAPPFTKFREPKRPEVAATPFPALSTDEINEILRKIETECKAEKDNLALCTNEESCGAAAVALQRCSAKMICPSVVKEFDDLVKKMGTEKEGADSEGGVTEEDLTRSFNAMTGCLENFSLACFSAKDETEEGKA